jgi:hypothetical protein
MQTIEPLSINPRTETSNIDCCCYFILACAEPERKIHFEESSVSLVRLSVLSYLSLSFKFISLKAEGCVMVSALTGRLFSLHVPSSGRTNRMNANRQEPQPPIPLETTSRSGPDGKPDLHQSTSSSTSSLHKGGKQTSTAVSTVTTTNSNSTTFRSRKQQPIPPKNTLSALQKSKAQALSSYRPRTTASSSTLQHRTPLSSCAAGSHSVKRPPPSSLPQANDSGYGEAGDAKRQKADELAYVAHMSFSDMARGGLTAPSQRASCPCVLSQFSGVDMSRVTHVTSKNFSSPLSLAATKPEASNSSRVWSDGLYASLIRATSSFYVPEPQPTLCAMKLPSSSTDTTSTSSAADSDQCDWASGSNTMTEDSDEKDSSSSVPEDEEDGFKTPKPIRTTTLGKALAISSTPRYVLHVCLSLYRLHILLAPLSSHLTLFVQL